jgi:hypothetical protein
METARPRGPAPSSETPPGECVRLGEGAGLDAALPAGEWECVRSLQRGGVSDAGLLRLLRLRTLYRRDADPATDGLDRPHGLQRDPRALFARWLVAQGRLNEGS